MEPGKRGYRRNLSEFNDDRKSNANFWPRAKYRGLKRTTNALYKKDAVMKYLLVVFTLLFSSNVYADHRLLGDLNNDGQVNFADFLVFVDEFGKPRSQQKTIVHGIDTLVVRDTITIQRELVIRDTIEVRRDEYVVGVDVDNHSGFFSTPFGRREGEQAVIDVHVLMLHKTYNNAISHIKVRDDSEGPAVKFKRHDQGQHDVVLSIPRNFDKASTLRIIAFQFSHEYAHILMNYRPAPGYNRQIWFEESIAIAVSYVVLKELKEQWSKSDKSVFREAASGIDAYLLHETYPFKLNDLPDIENSSSITEWYHRNKFILENHPPGHEENRERQKVVAQKVLRSFDRWPEQSWNAMRYFNTWPIEENRTIDGYLRSWFRYTPRGYQTPVRAMMYPFIDR